MARKSLAALVDAELAGDNPKSDSPQLPDSGSSVLPESRITEHPQPRDTGLPDNHSTEVAERGTSELPDHRSSEVADPQVLGTRSRLRQSRAPDVPKSQTPNGRDSDSDGLGDSVSLGVPKYLRLVRKEARLSAEQFDALTDLARRLNRRKARGVGERITENTLIRVAVDLLLAEAGRIEGTTEEELLQSLR